MSQVSRVYANALCAFFVAAAASIVAPAASGQEIALSLHRMANCGGEYTSPPQQVGYQRFCIDTRAIADQRDIQSARVIRLGGDDRPGLLLTLTDMAAEKLLEHTRSHIGQPLAFVISDRIAAAPIIREPVSKEVMIDAQFTDAEVNEIVQALNRRPKSL